MDGFTTARLIAERLVEDHLADLVDLHLDPEVSRYLGGVRSAEATKAYLDVNLGHWTKHGFGLWILKTAQGAFVGRAGIRPLALDGRNEIEIAYALRREFWGQGLATEVAHALVKIGLSVHSLTSLVGIVSVNNTPSRRVLERAGFKFEQTTLYHEDEVVVYRRKRDEGA